MSVTDIRSFKQQKSDEEAESLVAQLIGCYDEMLEEEFSLYIWATRQAFLAWQLLPTARKPDTYIKVDLDNGKTLLHDDTFYTGRTPGKSTSVLSTCLIGIGVIKECDVKPEVGQPEEIRTLLSHNASMGGLFCIQNIIRNLDKSYRVGAALVGTILFIEIGPSSDPQECVSLIVDYAHDARVNEKLGIIVPIEA